MKQTSKNAGTHSIIVLLEAIQPDITDAGDGIVGLSGGKKAAVTPVITFKNEIRIYVTIIRLCHTVHGIDRNPIISAIQIIRGV